MVVDRIVRETSLSAGDVSNALISLGAIVRDALELGQSVDLADLGSFRIIVPAKMMDTEAELPPTAWRHRKSSLRQRQPCVTLQNL